MSPEEWLYLLLLDLSQKAFVNHQLIQSIWCKGIKAAEAQHKKPSQEQAKARKQIVKKKSVSDLKYNLLLICPRENIKGQIHKRVSVQFSDLHGQSSTQMISNNLQSDAIL